MEGIHQIPQQGLGSGLPDAEGFHRAGDDHPFREPFQVGDGPVAEHHLTLPGRAREHQHVDAVGLHGYPGGGAPVVVQDGGPLWDHGLLEIVFRDRPPHGGEPVPNPLGRGLVVHQGPAKGLGHGNFGEVVTGGAQPPGGDENVRPLASNVHCLADPLRVVSHHGVIVDVDPQLGQSLGDHLGVGVGNVAQEKLRAHGDKFSGVAHGCSTTLSMPCMAVSIRPSISRAASASWISSREGRVLGWRGGKTVQQSS